LTGTRLLRLHGPRNEAVEPSSQSWFHGCIPMRVDQEPPSGHLVAGGMTIDLLRRPINVVVSRETSRSDHRPDPTPIAQDVVRK
jgi:hypothetical protein